MISTESSSTAPMDKSSFLDRVMIAAPCNVGWENMEGTERVRFCAECKQNVYNTSLMTKNEIQSLLAGEGRTPCLRIYRRADGTLITEDCPVGLRKIRDGWRRMAQVAASVWAVAVSLMPAWAQNQLPAGIGRVEGPRDKNVFEGEPVVLGGKPYTARSVGTLSGPEQLEPATRSKEWSSGRVYRRSEPVYLRWLACDRPSPDGGGNRIIGKVDFAALEFYKKAKQSVSEKDYDAAGKFFQASISALNLSQHDPKFVEKVFLDYSEFLESQHQENQARDVLFQWKVRSEGNKVRLESLGVNGTVKKNITLRGGRWFFGAVRGENVTVAPLPEGAPDPDLE